MTQQYEFSDIHILYIYASIQPIVLNLKFEDSKY